MFIQVIEGQTDDVAGVMRLMERWRDELASGAPGFLGCTSGVTADGTFVSLARFESPTSARENSDRDGQSAWWNEFEKLLAGPATFHDCSEVDVHLRGEPDEAGFVQVMQRERVTDRQLVRETDAAIVERMESLRPELLGFVRAWHDDGEGCTEAAYFTDEASAREGEKMEMPAELQEILQRAEGAASPAQFRDLTEPLII